MRQNRPKSTAKFHRAISQKQLPQSILGDPGRQGFLYSVRREAATWPLAEKTS